MNTANLKREPCEHCGMYHTTTCSRVRAFEYHPNGTLKRIEFHAPQPLVSGTLPDLKILEGVARTTGECNS